MASAQTQQSPGGAGPVATNQNTNASTVPPAYLLSNAPKKIASLNSARREKTTATLIAQLALAGQHVHRDRSGGFTCSKWGLSYHAHDLAGLQEFAKRLGVCE